MELDGQKISLMRSGGQGGVEPPTFRFSELGMIICRITFTFLTCVATLIRMLMNVGG
jgi:hypothetical protein